MSPVVQEIPDRVALRILPAYTHCCRLGASGLGSTGTIPCEDVFPDEYYFVASAHSCSPRLSTASRSSGRIQRCFTSANPCVGTAALACSERGRRSCPVERSSARFLLLLSSINRPALPGRTAEGGCLHTSRSLSERCTIPPTRRLQRSGRDKSFAGMNHEPSFPEVRCSLDCRHHLLRYIFHRPTG